MSLPDVFTVRTQALELAVNLANVGDVLEAQINVLLDTSAAAWTDPLAPTVPVTAYRPYFAIAHALLESPKFQQLSEASGVKFTGMANPIYSYFKLQHSLDLRYGWDVPPGMEVPDRYLLEGTDKGLILGLGTQSVEVTRTM